jgi:hypothetical protein
MFLVPLDGLWDSHARYRHYDGNIFTITLFSGTVHLLILSSVVLLPFNYLLC